MTITITAYKNRSLEFLLTVTDVNGDAAPFELDNDVTRLKIGSAGGVPLLDLTNLSPGQLTSFMSPRDNPCTLTLDQADLNAITPGIYDLEVAIVDDSDLDKIKHADKGVFVLIDTQLGDVGLTQT